MTGLATTLWSPPTTRRWRKAWSAKVASVLGEAIDARSQAAARRLRRHHAGSVLPHAFRGTISTGRRLQSRWSTRLSVPEDSPRSSSASPRRTCCRAAGWRGRSSSASTAMRPTSRRRRERLMTSSAASVCRSTPWCSAMGGDGHTASFFPDATTLPQLLATENQKLVMPVQRGARCWRAAADADDDA